MSFEAKIFPLRSILPPFNFCKPAKVLRIVVLPTPDGPNREII